MELIRTVTFPAISADIFGYPPDEAAKLAVASVRQFLAEEDHRIDEVTLVAFDAESLARHERLLKECE